MSVAFRRDGDEEHLEPRFEIPIPPGPNRTTARGLAMIGERIAALEAQLRGPDDETSFNLARRDLRYWQTRQITAELAPIPTGAVVDFGTRVTFRLNGQVQSLAIVGHDEADPAGGSIAFTAPLSRALMGAEPGEILPFQGRDGALEVISIEVVAS